jgi:hypothetical protein
MAKQSSSEPGPPVYVFQVEECARDLPEQEASYLQLELRPGEALDLARRLINGVNEAALFNQREQRRLIHLRGRVERYGAISSARSLKGQSA